MIRQAVTSTELLSVGYDNDKQILEVEFQTGGVYHYFGVQRDVYDSLLLAPSKGRFFNARIKPNYPFMRVE